MEKGLVLLLLAFAWLESFYIKGRLLHQPNLNNGDECLVSVECKSECCQKPPGLDVARCAAKGAENQQCSLQQSYGIFEKCPCESGLTCEFNKSVSGSSTNSNLGICHVSGRS